MWYWDDLDVGRLPRCLSPPQVAMLLLPRGLLWTYGDNWWMRRLKDECQKQPCFPCTRSWKDVRLMVWCIPPSQRRNYSRGGEFVYDCHFYFGSYILFGVCSYEQTMKKPIERPTFIHEHSHPWCPRLTGGKLLVTWSGQKSETWRATVATHFDNSCNGKSIGKSGDWWTKIIFTPEFYKAFVLLYLIK